MKNLYSLLFICCISYSLSAQQTLLNRSSFQVGGFGAPIVEFSDLNGNFGVSVGGGGGIMLNHFFIGAYGLGSTHDILADIDAERFEVTLAHGGLWLGYDFSPHQLVHVTSSFRGGYGVLLFGLEDDFSNYDYDDEIFTLTPEIGVELNVNRFMKIGTTFGYRWVKDVDSSPYAPDAFNSYVGSFLIKFGAFNNRYPRYRKKQRHRSN